MEYVVVDVAMLVNLEAHLSMPMEVKMQIMDITVLTVLMYFSLAHDSLI
ncbi:MAG: hypothetical protein ACOC10_02085 [Bacteroidota bacterium]